METKVKPKDEPATTTVGKKPVKSFRFQGVSVSIFANTVDVKGRSVTFFKTSLARTYKDGDNGFKSTTTFDADDLPVLTLLLQKAFDFISTQKLTENEVPSEQE